MPPVRRAARGAQLTRAQPARAPPRPTTRTGSAPPAPHPSAHRSIDPRPPGPGLAAAAGVGARCCHCPLDRRPAWTRCAGEAPAHRRYGRHRRQPRQAGAGSEPTGAQAAGAQAGAGAHQQGQAQAPRRRDDRGARRAHQTQARVPLVGSLGHGNGLDVARRCRRPQGSPPTLPRHGTPRAGRDPPERGAAAVDQDALVFCPWRRRRLEGEVVGRQTRPLLRWSDSQKKSVLHHNDSLAPSARLHTRTPSVSQVSPSFCPRARTLAHTLSLRPRPLGRRRVAPVPKPRRVQAAVLDAACGLALTHEDVLVKGHRLPLRVGPLDDLLPTPPTTTRA
jgi:hypothetical protein